MIMSIPPDLGILSSFPYDLSIFPSYIYSATSSHWMQTHVTKLNSRAVLVAVPELSKHRAGTNSFNWDSPFHIAMKYTHRNNILPSVKSMTNLVGLSLNRRKETPSRALVDNKEYLEQKFSP